MAEGREAALAELIARHGRGLTLFATRFLGDPALADEVAQDTFLRAWREAARYDPARGAATTWLYRIAANLCRDRLRRARLRRMLWRGPRAEDLSEVLADPAPGAAATLEGRQRLAATRQALARLPERQRLAILLTVVAGMDNAEAAAIMATSRGSVEQLLIRARRALRAGLLEGSDDDGG
jgi:RNA polymerase sigma-70 factor (ECF subfamily)